MTLVSPKQVARAIGVSESSLKRWCDQGRLPATRTAGGHRKLSLDNVVQFVREQGYPLVDPAVLGLPACSNQASRALSRAPQRLVEALLAGDEPVTRQIVIDLYLARHALSVIFDAVIAPAFHAIGELWACQTAEVYQERRACAIVSHLLFELRRLQSPPPTAQAAMGATLPGDLYELPGRMAELVLRDSGFDAVWQGVSIPGTSLAAAVRNIRPKLFWLSVSHVADEAAFLAEFATLSAACAETGTALVVGGRALAAGLRSQMTYSAFGDTMQHLEAFAATLRSKRRAAPGVRRRSKSRKS